LPNSSPSRPGSRAPHLQAGAAAEILACDYLSRHGLTCLARNFRCRVGEIDLVMREQRGLVMVEVRYRALVGQVSPMQSITREKQQRLARAASYWLGRNPAYTDWPLRFDVVSLSGRLDSAEISWERGAIEFDEESW
jgi:putative endonuclease